MFHLWFYLGVFQCFDFTQVEPVISVKDTSILYDIQFQSQRVTWCYDQRIWDPGISYSWRINESVQEEPPWCVAVGEIEDDGQSQTTYLGSRLAVDDLPFSRLAVDDLPGSRLVNAEMMRQLHAVYGEWLLKDGCWNFVVDHFKGARMLFLNESSTHADLVAMAQEDYNLDMNTESVELTYSLQQMAPDLPPIHVTSDRQVRNLLEITKTHEVRLCVSSFSKMRTVSEERDEDHVGDEAEERDEAEEGDEADVSDEDEEGDKAEEGDEAEEGHEAEEGDEAEDHDGEEDADIPVVADAEDYSEYGKVKDEDEEEDDEICFDDYKGAYGCEGEGSSADRIYVNQSFASKDALLSELRLTAVRRRFSFRIFKSTKTLFVATCRVSGCQWKVRTESLSGNVVLRRYSENIYPCVGQLVEARTCFPPEVKRGPGRQKKSRWQSWLELSRMRGRKPRKQHRVYRCSVCKETGHKRPQCKN
ncbi:hypothetical protein IGI04_034061 [Brassica rapa subsp. trilocularis]|uniref:Transposase MuDR plant domain-containing protein n=1 Tax=Brassica rapa subsp. trilocularis TaxID=1813537 RepID=A0ABQ7L7M8_BRACM|nr:hypothetical protein IGI04_034061 [Brassica rapa subsp. trilocularis]